ncbi:hypothetical protein FFLO_06647 [Filobasidium floriforme]|uniref:Uncharacterized protein n=1 Tax=Filobasidium floriforme TaxID=5210 RepID=A0A8K0JGW3_9TREE|nr:hypothetical protein FFLO_06647 [Filobasidium floriforme]
MPATPKTTKNHGDKPYSPSTPRGTSKLEQDRGMGFVYPKTKSAGEKEHVWTEELACTAFLADSPTIPSLKRLWKEGNVAGFDGLMAQYRGGWKWCCLNCFSHEDRFHLSAENSVPGYVEDGVKGWYNVIEFEGMFVCCHPLPDAGKSSGQGSSCFPCRGTNIKCAPLPSTFMTVFDPAYGIRARYQAACEVLTIPNVPHPVAIAVADEFQRIMKLMVLPLLSDKTDCLVETRCLPAWLKVKDEYRRRYFVSWSQRHPYTRNANGTITIPDRDAWDEEKSYRIFLFKGHGEDVGEPPVVADRPVGQEYDADILRTPTPSPSPSPTPTPAAGKRKKKKVVASSEGGE